MNQAVKFTTKDVVQAMVDYAQAKGLLPYWDGIRNVDAQFTVSPTDRALLGSVLTLMDPVADEGKHENPTPPQQQGAAADQERVVEPQAETVR